MGSHYMYARRRGGKKTLNKFQLTPFTAGQKKKLTTTILFYQIYFHKLHAVSNHIKTCLLGAGVWRKSCLQIHQRSLPSAHAQPGFSRQLLGLTLKIPMLMDFFYFMKIKCTFFYFIPLALHVHTNLFSFCRGGILPVIVSLIYQSEGWCSYWWHRNC